MNAMRANHDEDMQRMRTEADYNLQEAIKKKFVPFKKQYDELRETVEELESKYHAAIQEREDDTEQHVVAVKKAYKEEERKLMARMQEMKGRMEDMERNAGKVRGAGSSR